MAHEKKKAPRRSKFTSHGTSGKEGREALAKKGAARQDKLKSAYARVRQLEKEHEEDEKRWAREDKASKSARTHTVRLDKPVKTRTVRIKEPVKMTNPQAIIVKRKKKKRT